MWDLIVLLPYHCLPFFLCVFFFLFGIRNYTRGPNAAKNKGVWYLKMYTDII